LHGTVDAPFLTAGELRHAEDHMLLSQLHSQGVLGFSGARQIILRNRQRLRSMDA